MIKAFAPYLNSTDVFALYCRDVLSLAGTGPVIAALVQRPFSPVYRDGLLNEIGYSTRFGCFFYAIMGENWMTKMLEN